MEEKILADIIFYTSSIWALITLFYLFYLRVKKQNHKPAKVWDLRKMEQMYLIMMGISTPFLLLIILIIMAKIVEKKDVRNTK